MTELHGQALRRGGSKPTYGIYSMLPSGWWSLRGRGLRVRAIDADKQSDLTRYASAVPRLDLGVELEAHGVLPMQSLELPSAVYTRDTTEPARRSGRGPRQGGTIGLLAALALRLPGAVMLS